MARNKITIIIIYIFFDSQFTFLQVQKFIFHPLIDVMCIQYIFRNGFLTSVVSADSLWCHLTLGNCGTSVKSCFACQFVVLTMPKRLMAFNTKRFNMQRSLQELCTMATKHCFVSKVSVMLHSSTIAISICHSHNRRLRNNGNLG